MERYYFLFGLAFIWIMFAVAQDLKKREIANWLNFSLIGFALAYRAIYASWFNDWKFLILGLIGFGIFFVLANLFYYSRVFAGGDAKLLMGIGAVLPYENYIDLAYVGLGFVALLLLAGAVYSLIYSIFLSAQSWIKFKKNFKDETGKRKKMFLISLGFSVLMFACTAFGIFYWGIALIAISFSFFIAFLYIYLKALEGCMIKLAHPEKLTEGDWLEQEITIGNYVVRKSVHGLSMEDIKRLKKAGRKALIKEGIPFSPAFLVAFLIMVSFLAVSGLQSWMVSLLF